MVALLNVYLVTTDMQRVYSYQSCFMVIRLKLL